ncbi:phosphotransferase [Actinomadura madurae]|uniref:maltokinase N-terminal cap-like domain-containing protein n=1 Tax=Actinomadura madurae TaxID=1993 RepID=UPI0020264C71|nr:phosphotransferase [Actinomadura madurae]MCP9965324.1 phosphotransferase [Actinomadura madurae]URM94195.1 phosphotransferase [Actinomadura madurae]
MLPPAPDLVRHLTEWLPRQRWFGGKDGPIDGLAITTATELHPGDPALHHLIIDVHQNTGTDHYQILLGVRRDLPDRLRYAEIGAPTGEHDAKVRLYDAAHDPDLTRILLDDLAREASAGPLRFHRADGTRIRTDLASLPITSEQSNTSLLFGDAYICKLFRRLSEGVNLDLEVNLALTRGGCPHVPAVLGWIELDPGALAGGTGEPITLGLLSDYLHTGADGWSLAIASVRDWYAHTPAPGDGEWAELDASAAGGDFAAEAGRLGAATAAVHRALADAFGVTTLPAAEVRSMAARMNAELTGTCRAVPRLAPHAKALTAAFLDLAAQAEPLPVQRVHGDYHLGQVLRTESGWTLLDFEGEPARTQSERRALAHPLRDVAGMLRSFEYAARFLITKAGTVPTESGPWLETRAHAWAARNRAAFCAGYAAAGGPDPAAHAALIRAFEFEKAVYEVRYEARNRPAWLPVPLTSLAHLTA